MILVMYFNSNKANVRDLVDLEHIWTGNVKQAPKSFLKYKSIVGVAANLSWILNEFKYSGKFILNKNHGKCLSRACHIASSNYQIIIVILSAQLNKVRNFMGYHFRPDSCTTWSLMPQSIKQTTFSNWFRNGNKIKSLLPESNKILLARPPLSWHTLHLESFTKLLVSQILESLHFQVGYIILMLNILQSHEVQ